jgi:hypothetical protein
MRSPCYLFGDGSSLTLFVFYEVRVVSRIAKLKQCDDLAGNRTRDFLVCSILS